jgi:hypothetical protein
LVQPYSRPHPLFVFMGKKVAFVVRNMPVKEGRSQSEESIPSDTYRTAGRICVYPLVSP